MPRAFISAGALKEGGFAIDVNKCAMNGQCCDLGFVFQNSDAGILVPSVTILELGHATGNQILRGLPPKWVNTFIN